MKDIKEGVMKTVKKLMPEMMFLRLWAFYVAHSSKYETGRYRHAYFHKGKEGKEKYCILRYAAPGMGILAAARNSLLAFEWATHNGMIPVVDLEWEYCFKYDSPGRENMWEYIFEQRPSVRELYEKKSVFVGGVDEIFFFPAISEKILGSREENLIRFKEENWREYYRQLSFYSNKWLAFRPEIKDRFENTYAKLFGSGRKILGVALREEFSMKEKEIKGSRLTEHPHEPEISEMIRFIKEYIEKWNCTHVFVTTMFEDSINILKKEFGDRLLYTERKRKKFDEYWKWKKDADKYFCEPDELYLRLNRGEEDVQIFSTWGRKETVEYVEEVYGISICDCLLSAKNGGSLFACIWNGGKYEHLKILEDKHKSELY